MSRNHRELKIFAMADDVVAAVYLTTRQLPSEEKYGLQSQIRRAAISVPTNIVEGCARKTNRELAQFVRIALGSASEVKYLLEIALRLELLAPSTSELIERYSALVKAINGFLLYLEETL